MAITVGLADGRVELISVGPARTGTQWELLDYCPPLGRYSRFRILQYELTGELQTLKNLMNRYLHAKIVNTIAHEPQITQDIKERIAGQLTSLTDVAAWQRIKDVDGLDLIDEFGMHVYLRSELDFYGKQEDVDLRYNT
jgi:hypothetical protein